MTAIWSIFRGSAYGLVLGAVLIMMLALLGPQPDGSRLWDGPEREPAQIALQDREAELGDAAPNDDLGELTVSGVQEDPIEFGQPSVPGDTADLGAAVISGTESAPVPRVGLTLPAPTTPNDANLALPETETFTPVLPNPLSVAPEIPQSEQDIVIATAPATPQPPVVVEDEQTEIADGQEVIVVTDAPETAEIGEDAPQEDVAVVEVIEQEDAPAVLDPAPIAQDVALAPTTPAVAPTVEEVAPTLDVALADAPDATAPTLDTQEAGLVSPQATNDIDAPDALADAGTAPNVEDVAPTVDVATTTPPDATIPTLDVQDAGLVSPQVANTINTPDTLADAAESQDLDAALGLAEAPVDEAPTPATEPLAEPNAAVELAIADETATQPRQPRASVNEDAVDLAAATTPATETAPDLSDLANADEEGVNAPTLPADIANPDPTVQAAVPNNSLDDVTRPAEPAPVDVAQADVPEQPKSEPTVRILGRETLASALPTSTSGVRINRSITRDTPEAETAEVEPDADPAPTSGPASARFAAPFTNDQDLPLVTVLLKDDGVLDDAASALGVLQTPVTIVLDPTLPDASDRAAEYRAAGLEVAMSIALPFGATASDAAIVLEAGLIEVQDAVALVDLTQNGLMSNRDIAGQIRQAAGEEGRGLVVPVVGLGGLRNGTVDVPMVEIFRDLNSAQQNTRTLGRFLDQAAFEARQQGNVVLTGQLNAETIAALVTFMESPRGQQVALAPVSAALN